MKSQKGFESGQIMVILAAAFVALLGFGALTIDLGMTYADRRSAQNAADAAALSAAQKMADQIKSYTSFTCATESTTASSTAAISRATANSYTITLNGANNGVSFVCPPNGANNYMDIKVKIRAETKTSFMHFFFGGKMVNDVEGTSRVYPRQPKMAGFVVYVLDTTCSQDGIDWNGTADAFLINGGAFTRSCLNGNGNTKFKVIPPNTATPQCNAGASGATTYTISCSDANQAAHPGWCTPGGNYSPTPQFIRDPLPDFTMPDITTCSATVITTPPANGNFTPGTYQIDSNSWDGAKLAPGLYCIKGSIRLQGNGAKISSVDGPGVGGTTHGVTLFMENGGITCTGNCGVNLKAVAQDAPNKPLGAIPGLVLMSKHGNTSTITLGGNSGSDFGGTVYVPDGAIDVGGTGDVPTSSQFISKSIKSHGNSQICVNYNPNMVMNDPAILRLQK